VRIALVVAVVVVVAAGNGAASDAEPGVPVAHVRCLTHDAQGLLDMAIARSPVIRSFVERLEHSDVVVYLRLPGESDPQAAVSHLTFVAFAAGMRFLLVQIDPWRTIPCDRIALIGHELYHPLEIAQAPGVRDQATLRALYRRIGHEYSSGRFETEPVRMAGQRVRAKLEGPSETTPGVVSQEINSRPTDSPSPT
jgi:hypothetical protein